MPPLLYDRLVRSVRGPPDPPVEVAGTGDVRAVGAAEEVVVAGDTGAVGVAGGVGVGALVVRSADRNVSRSAAVVRCSLVSLNAISPARSGMAGAPPAMP